MRFGHFFYPMKFDDSNDERAIQECLAEAELVEDLGFDAIWITEHYFTGECVYGDPLVFASALAVKTKSIDIGFGILELPLHNQVRVAIQTALLDNLCQGRLIVGTAKGSNYNAYEYVGFGSDPRLGVEQMEEAEELLIKARPPTLALSSIRVEGTFSQSNSRRPNVSVCSTTITLSPSSIQPVGWLPSLFILVAALNRWSICALTLSWRLSA